MDALQIEYAFAHALEIEMGKRGEVNDADYVRSGKAKYLVNALDKVLLHLKQRAHCIEESDAMKMWIDRSIGDLGMVQDSIRKLDEKGEVSHPACFQFWCLSAISVKLIDSYLRKQGC